MNEAQRIALVTGANRGLGFEACRQLALKGFHVILASRQLAKGQKAASQLQAEGLDVSSLQLDVTDEQSLFRLEKFVREDLGRLDVIINNAGLFIRTEGEFHARSESVLHVEVETLRKSMETNVYGPMRICQLLVPIMKRNNYGRIVNVSSGMGQLSGMNGGWPGYRVSKTALNAITCILADELRNNNILVNSMCPGWVRTDMGGMQAPRTPEQGVKTMIWLATLPDNGPRGGFFRDQLSIDW